VGPEVLSQLLNHLPKMNDANLLVGTETSDDAAVYRLNDDTALIQTLDFFTPVVDDPYTFGQIAAANSLSDIYAMGGKPLLALNIVCFPSCLSVDVFAQILKGGADKVLEAGAVVVGGHSVEDDEPKYGLSVTGAVHPDRVLRNFGCREGDVLILTKPLGTGIINTAIKGEMASDRAYEKAVKVMTTLNKYASEIIAGHEISACTDITGFGLMGHGYEMASASHVTIRFDKDRIHYMEEAKEYAEMGLVPGGAYNNREYLDGKYSISGVPAWLEDILFDPQTSGGLLFACSQDEAGDILKKLSKLNLQSAIIGEVLPLGDKFIEVR
jgi:selenide,water dikinase